MSTLETTTDKLTSRAVAIALDSRTAHEFAKSLLPELQHHLGADRLLLATPATTGWRALHKMHLSDAEERRIHAGWRTYSRELEPVMRAALLQGAAVDRDVLAAGMERSTFYQEVQVPLRANNTLVAMLRTRTAIYASLSLAREGVFQDGERQALARLAPTLTLALRQFQPIQPAPAGIPHSLTRVRVGGGNLQVRRLSSREEEIVQYVCLGYTNPEIAVACGLSRNTIRNRLAHVFRKANVSTRAELVYWATGHLDENQSD